MIKKMTMLALTVCTLCATEAQAQIKLGGKTLNAQKLVQAGADMIKAVTLSDADITTIPCRPTLRPTANGSRG